MKDSPEKYRREIQRRLPKGYKIGYLVKEGDDATNRSKRTIGTYRVIFDPQGELVREPSGRPVHIATTPGSSRSLKQTLLQIRKAGVKIT